MKKFFSPNINTKGRMVRGVTAVALLVGAVLAFHESIWLALPLLACGGFVLFESLRGWCVLRACGVRTKL